MTSDSKHPWILAGYHQFAIEGPSSLKVDTLARGLDKSRSSFYHHFADIDIFIEALLAYHLECARIMIEKERNCTSFDPELITVLLEHKQDLLFNRQLRVNRKEPLFEATVQKVDGMVGDSIVTIWAEAIDLQEQNHLAKMILGLVQENFFLQITEETLTKEWLRNFIHQIRVMVQHFRMQEV